jgi:hypothetical protein
MRVPAFVLLPVLAALLGSPAGCSPKATRAPNATRPVSERKAVEIIARAVRKNRLEAAEGRDVRTVSSGLIHADVIVDDHKLAVAYLTGADLEQEGSRAEPKKGGKQGGALLVESGSGKADAGMHLLMLFERDYLYDDQVGEDHEQTAITAEGAIERDVTDFLVQAKARGWE